MGAETSQLLACLTALYGERAEAFAAFLIGDSDDWHWAELVVSGWQEGDPYWQALPQRAQFDPEGILGSSTDPYAWQRNALWQLLARCRRDDWKWLLEQLAVRIDDVENRWILVERVKDSALSSPRPERGDLLRWIDKAVAREPERFSAPS